MAIFPPLFPTHEHLVIPSFHCHTGKMLLALVDRDQESTAYRKASSTEDHPAQNVDSLKGEVSKSTAIPLKLEELYLATSPALDCFIIIQYDPSLIP